MMAARFGEVTGGKYIRCTLGLAQEQAKKKLLSAGAFDTFVFYKMTKEVARVPVAEIKSYRVIAQNPRGTVISIRYADNETSTINVSLYDSNGRPYPNDHVGAVLGALASTSCE